MMWVGIVGSRTLGECDCAAQSLHWPPKADEPSHPEGCQKVEAWLLAMSVVTRLARQPNFEGIVSGGAKGADTLAKDAGVLLGVRVEEIKPKGGREAFWIRAQQRNQKIVTKVAKSGGWIVALFAPGPRSPGTSDTIERAKAAGLKTFIHEYREGQGRWVTE